MGSCPYLIFFFFGKRDKHSCSASAIINFSMVSIVDSLLSTLHASANRILRCETNAYFIGSGYAGSVSFFFSDCRPRFSRLAAFPLNARARVHNLFALKKWVGREKALASAGHVYSLNIPAKLVYMQPAGFALTEGSNNGK